MYNKALERIKDITQNCSQLACSYATEATALANGLEEMIREIEKVRMKARLEGQDPNIERNLLCITDSQSVLAALRGGPIKAKDPLIIRIWLLLMRLAEMNVYTHLQFVYSHCGVPENTDADELAGAYEKPPTIPTTAATWETDAFNFLRRKVLADYNAKVLKERKKPSHRQEILGLRPSPLRSTRPITGKMLSRRQCVDLTRMRCGESEMFGAFHYRIRDMSNLCRWCMPQQAKPPIEKSNIMVSEDDKLLCKYCYF